MLTWLSANLSTLLISLVLFAVVISIVRYLIRQKKQGKHTCGCRDVYKRQLKEVPRIVDYLRSISPVWKDLASGKKQFML